MADIVISHLNKAYGGKRVLRDVSMTLPEGRFACLMAPSGAGKTTLLRILAGLEPPDSGVIEGLDGARLGVVFQEDRLVEWLDAAENLRLVNARLEDAAIRDALVRFGLDGIGGQPVKELSGGMRRRVALLRALMSECDALLMDEPFNGLDADTREIARRECLRMARGRTALLVTHDPEDAAALGAKILRL